MRKDISDHKYNRLDTVRAVDTLVERILVDRFSDAECKLYQRKASGRKDLTTIFTIPKLTLAGISP